MGRRRRRSWRRKLKFKPADILRRAPPWIDLPLDLTADILQRLDAVEILGNAQKVCSKWWNLCKDPSMWNVINIVNPDGPKHTSRGHCTIMCRRAVDRSQGQLTDLSLAYFGDDELLDYIIQRSRHLRSLTLTCCNEIKGTALVEAIKRVPELEELHLLYSRNIYIRDDDIETIGISCPMLMSFTLNVLWGERPGNKEALAIAKSMPNLQHLRILGNRLDNEGLRAILDGCPCLESLDLRGSFGVDLDGALGKRCGQIQRLRLPSELVRVDDSGGFLFFPSYYQCEINWNIYDYEFEYSEEYWIDLMYERDDYYSWKGYGIYRLLWSMITMWFFGNDLILQYFLILQ